MKMQTGKEKNYFGRSSGMVQYYAASTHSSLKDRVSPKVHPFTAQWRVFPEISKKKCIFSRKGSCFFQFFDYNKFNVQFKELFMRGVSLKDIAEKCNVSMQAVSLALKPDGYAHGTTKVSEKTKALVRQVAREMGYQSNIMAVALRGGMSRSIGIVQPSFIIAPNTELLNCVVRTLNAEGFETFITSMPLQSTEKDPDTLIRQFSSRCVDGIIFLRCDNVRLSKSYDLPILITGDHGPYGINIRRGTEILAEHLITVHGHRRIGLVGALAPDDPKLAGYKAKLTEHEIRPSADWIIHVLKNPASMRQLRDAVIKEKLTAFLCTNDFIAARLSRYLQRHGIRIPEDIAVTGFDGMSFTKFTSPTITTVIQPMEHFGKLVARIMIDKIIHGKGFPREQILLEPKLRIGQSCGCAVQEENYLTWINTFQTIEEDEETVYLYDTTPLPEQLQEDLSYEEYHK